MKWKLFARRMSVSAPRMTVKRHIPLPIRVAIWSIAATIAGFVGVGLWQATVGAGAQERERLAAESGELRQRLAQETRQRTELSALAKSADSRLQIEKTTAEKLTQQVQSLEAENARLKSELAYMEGLLPSKAGQSGDAAGLSLRQFEVQADAAPGQYRYRALLVQGGREQRDFIGTTQILFSNAVSGKSETLTFPSANDKALLERMQVKFRRTLRLEGVIELPKGFVPKTVQLRVLEQGILRAQSQVAL
jgi:hypothetical protein